MMRIRMNGYRWAAVALFLLGAGMLTVGILAFLQDLGKI